MIKNINERVQQLTGELDKERIFEEMLEKREIEDRVNELVSQIKYEIIRWEIEPKVNQIKTLQENLRKHQQQLDGLTTGLFWKKIIEERLNKKVIQWHREAIKKIEEEIQEYLKKIEVIEFIIKAHLAERCWECGEVFIPDLDYYDICEKCGASNPKLKKLDENQIGSKSEKAHRKEVVGGEISNDKIAQFRVREGDCFYGVEKDRFSIRTLWEGGNLSEFPFREYTGGETIDHRTGKVKMRIISWIEEPFEFYGGHSDLEVLVWTEKKVNGEWMYYRLPEYYVLVANTYYEKFAEQERKKLKAI